MITFISMLFNLGYQSLTLLFFVVQILIFALLLFRKGIINESSSDKWLSLLLLLCAMYLAPWMFGHAGWYAHDGYREFLFFVPFHQYFLFGPVMLFLTRSITLEQGKLSKKDLLHFIPAGLYFIYTVVVAIGDLLVFEEFYFYADGYDKDLKPWYQITGLTSMVIYATISLKHYSDYRKRILQTLSYADSVKLRWLKEFLFALVIIIVLRGAFIVILPEIGDWGVKWWYYLIFGAISYYMAIAAWSSSIKHSALVTNTWDSVEIEEEYKHAVDSLELDDVMQKVNDHFNNEAVYKNPTLSLPQLAKMMGTNTSILSKAINKRSEFNFNDFVNRYRIEAVKRAIADGELQFKTLTGLALDAGFNSKSTFIRSFKKLEGMTPSEYIKTTHKS
ncbi:MAG: hypothetical protein Tsb0034_20780 [Ekhidna sp.]